MAAYKCYLAYSEEKPNGLRENVEGKLGKRNNRARALLQLQREGENFLLPAFSKCQGFGYFYLFFFSF